MVLSQLQEPRKVLKVTGNMLIYTLFIRKLFMKVFNKTVKKALKQENYLQIHFGT